MCFALLGPRLFFFYFIFNFRCCCPPPPFPLFILYTNDIRAPVLMGFVSQCVQNAGGKTLIHVDYNIVDVFIIDNARECCQ